MVRALRRGIKRPVDRWLTGEPGPSEWPAVKPLATLVVGARPNFVKAAALVPPLEAEGFRVRLVHTGQHADPGMSAVFFRDLGLPRPDGHLGAGPGRPLRQLARMLAGLEMELASHPPAAVIVVGDVTSTLAGALAASRLGIPLAHVEAGMRSFDRRMPEEMNRMIADRLSDLLFTTSAEEDRNLLREGISRSRIFRAGDVMADSLLRHRRRAAAAGRAGMRRLGLRPRGFGLVTLHRAGNVDDPRRLRRLMDGLGRAAGMLPLLFPVHPRTRKRLRGLRIPAGLRLLPPLGYLEFLGLMDRAALVLTDSGGVQLEASVLGVPCLTLRETTERPALCRMGTNRLVGDDPAAIARWTARILAHPPQGRRLRAWDGQAGRRIARALRARLGTKPFMTR